MQATQTTFSTPMLPSARDLAVRVFRKKYLVLAVIALVIGLAFLTGQFKKTYQAQMTILVRKERVDSVLTPVQNSTPELQQLDVSEAELNSEVELLKTPDLLQEVVVTAHLLPPGETNATKMARAVRTLGRDLDVESVPKTVIIVVKYAAADPQTAQRVLSDLGQLYLKKHQELRGSSHEISFLDERVTEHRAALETAENKLLAFTKTTGVISAGPERDATVQQMESLQQQELETRAAIADAQQRSASLDQALDATAPRVATASRTSQNAPLLENLKATLLALQLKRSALLAKYNPQYRLVQDVDAQIAITEKMLSDENATQLTETSTDVNPMLPKLRADTEEVLAQLSGLRARDQVLARSASSLRSEAEGLQSREIEQAQLQRQVELEQTELQLYRDKRRQAEMAAALDERGILNVVIAQPAMASPLPVRSLPFVLLAVLLAAVVLGIGAALLADLFDPTVRSAAELESILGISNIEEFQTRDLKRGVA